MVDGLLCFVFLCSCFCFWSLVFWFCWSLSCVFCFLIVCIFVFCFFLSLFLVFFCGCSKVRGPSSWHDWQTLPMLVFVCCGLPESWTSSYKIWFCWSLSGVFCLPVVVFCFLFFLSLLCFWFSFVVTETCGVIVCEVTSSFSPLDIGVRLRWPFRTVNLPSLRPLKSGLAVSSLVYSLLSILLFYFLCFLVPQIHRSTSGCFYFHQLYITHWCLFWSWLLHSNNHM